MSLDSRQTTWSVIFALAAVAIFSGASGTAILVGGLRTHCTAEDSAKTQIRMYEEAIGMYRHDVGLYPPAEQGLEALRVPPSNATEMWRGPYVTMEIQPDPWGNPYEYHLAANGQSFVMFTPGRDGALGTTDDIFLPPHNSGAP